MKKFNNSIVVGIAVYLAKFVKNEFLKVSFSPQLMLINC